MDTEKNDPKSQPKTRKGFTVEGKRPPKQEIAKLLSDDFWPIPKWLEQDDKATSQKSFNDYFKYNLQTRYIEIEGDFRTTCHNFAHSEGFDEGTMKRIAEFLRVSRKALEGDEVDLMNVASLLNLAERYIIWLFPEYSAKKRASIKAQHLESKHPQYAAYLVKELEKAENSTDGKALALKAAYDEIIGEINKHETQSQISSGLQIERLEVLRGWGFISLLIALLAFPLISNFEWVMNASVENSNALLGYLENLPSYVSNLIMLVGLTLMGALGGFISGLLQVRNTRVNLIEFKESLLKFQLKPIVGGLTAVLIVVLLSWQVLPGIEIKDMGAFILLSFLTGFSERYFLKLLKIDGDGVSAYIPAKPEREPDANSKEPKATKSASS